MAKKSAKSKQRDAGYPVEPQDLEQQQSRLKMAAAAGAAALKVAPVHPGGLGPVGEASVSLERPATPKGRFTLFRPEAREVYLAGDFNDWSPRGTALQRNAEGVWEVNLPLAPGRYQYKFVIDGEWIADPVARHSVTNDFGSVNSLVEIP